jgi:hypothetical protein
VPQNDHRQLARAVKRLARTFDEKPASTPPTDPIRQSEFTRMSAQVKAADQALTMDLEALARQVIERARAQRADWSARLDAIRGERGDVERRRRELAAAAQGWDWPVAHFDQRDAVGPFTIQHTANASIVKLGRLRLEKLEFPSGAEVFGAVRAARERLDREARDLWPDLKRTLLPLQEAPGSSITWKRLLAAAAVGSAARKREPAIVFALALLRAGELETGWSLQTRPPALAEQRDSVSVPHIRRPGDATRAHAVRLQETGAAA